MAGSKQAVAPGGKNVRDMSFRARAARDIKRNWEIYLILVPVVIYYLVFSYAPMGGVVIAFQNWRPSKPMFGAGAAWVGLKNFKDFFGSYYFVRVLKNTLTISLSSLIFGFPAPVLLALMLNELKSKYYARCVQTMLYLPHFVSMVVLCGLIVQFVGSRGVITQLLGFFGFPQTNMLQNPALFVPIYVISNIWSGVGWGSIIYLAALTGIDQQLYEAAEIDGAGKWKQTLNITLPSIAPTIVIQFIMRTGQILSVGQEKIILLYNEGIYETADVISSFVYRKGLLEMNWSYSTAVGLFNSVINFIMVSIVNKISATVSETSLW